MKDIMDKKILILSMSCNHPYYQGLLGAVKNTWAKSLIQNKYPNVTWFGYTSCDSHHPKPCVDFEDHMIYVDSKDGLGSTYSKTQKAYNMIKDMVDFDYVVRTNTSVFINVDNLINRVNSFPENTVMGRYWIYELDGNMYYMVMGFCFGMDKHLFDISMTADDNYIVLSNGEVFVADDDRILSKRLIDVYGLDFNKANIDDTPNAVIYIYKGVNQDYDKSDLEKRELEHNIKIVYQPELVNSWVMIKVRSFYEKIERIEKGHEIEHMYELYNSLRLTK